MKMHSVILCAVAKMRKRRYGFFMIIFFILGKEEKQFGKKKLK